jgi:hypothetical protein
MPRQLDLHEDVINGLSSYLRKELTNHRAERSKLEDRWIAEEKDFWAEPSEVQEELPITGFAKLIIPITAIAVEAVHARDMGQIFGLKELIAVEVADSANNVRQGLDKLFNNEFLEVMQFRKKMESPLLQMTKNGTGLALVGYKNDKSNAIVLRDGKEMKVPVYKEKGASIDGIDINDFLMPFYATDICDAPWVGHQFRVSEYGLKQLCAKGTLPPDSYEALHGYYNTISDQSNRKLQEIREETDTQPVFPSEIVITRLLLDWDVDDTDPDNPEYSRIEVYFHETSGKVLGVTYADEERDYEKGVYWPLEYRWYGYGIAKQNHEFQAEITTQHRQRLDNATIANMAMFKVKRDATWIKDDEPIFPGKKWFVENMDDIEPMFIGDVKSSAYNNENQVVIYSQQRTGVNELTLGMPNVGTPGTASDSLARVQESTRKFDYTYNNKKDFINRVIYKASQQIIKYGVSQRDVYEYIPNGSAVETFLKQGDALKNRLLFNIQLAGAKNNKVLDRNTYTQLAGMYTQYATQSMALVQQMGNPQMQQAYAEKALVSADIIMLEILRAFDVPNPDKLVFNFDVIKQQAAAAIPPSPVGGIPAESPSAGSITGSPITNILAPNAGITTDSITAPGGITGANLSFAG